MGIILLIASNSVALGQKLKLITKKDMNSEKIREQCYVLKKKKFVKNGTYKLFHENAVLKVAGQYDNNKRVGEWKEYDMSGNLKRLQSFEKGRKTADSRVGIWYWYYENEEVIAGFDYDKKAKIDVEIRVDVYYPAIERENEREGIVKVLIKFDDDCEVSEVKVIESLSQGCDEQAVKGVRRMCELQRLYDKEYCRGISRIIPIKFELN